MEVKVFVDVLFIINFIIDYVLLQITAFFIKQKPKTLKLLLGAAVGAVFAAAIFFVKLNTFFSFLSVVAVAFLMITISYGVKKSRILLKNTAVFFLVAMAASGLAFGVVLSGRAKGVAINNGAIYADVDAYVLLLVFVVTVLIIHFATGYIRKQKIKSSYLYEIVIEKNGRKVKDVAFFDSGNFLKDPITQKGVIVAEWKTISPLFDEEIVTQAIVNNPKDFFYIGCRGIDGVGGMYAFSPDSVKSDEIDFHESVLIAITEATLDKDGSYSMLLPNNAKIH